MAMAKNDPNVAQASIWPEAKAAAASGGWIGTRSTVVGSTPVLDQRLQQQPLAVRLAVDRHAIARQILDRRDAAVGRGDDAVTRLLGGVADREDLERQAVADRPEMGLTAAWWVLIAPDLSRSKLALNGARGRDPLDGGVHLRERLVEAPLVLA